MSRYDAMAANLRRVEEAVQYVRDPYMRRIAFELLLVAVGEQAAEQVPHSRIPSYDAAPTEVIPAYREGAHRG